MTALPAAEPGLLGVALTGSHGELAELAEGLEGAGLGIGVVAQVTDVHGDALAAVDPDVVVHCPWWSDGDLADAPRALQADVEALRRQTAAPIVLLVGGADAPVVEAALACAVEDVLLVPQRIESIAFTVRKAGQAGARRPVAAPVAEPAGGRVVTVFSPKGGTGKTVIATNVSAYLARRSRKRVLLIDLDLQFGDAAIMLGLDPERTMFDLVEAGGDLDPEKLTGYTTRHPSGLDVLVAPLLPEHADHVGEAWVLKLVEVAREAYDLVVIDTSPFFYGPMLALLGPTDQLLMLCGLDVPTLKNVRVSLRTLELLGFPPQRTNLVLNRVTPDVGLVAKDVEEALGLPVAFEVPNESAVAQAVNRGAVPALHEQESEFAKAVARIAGAIEPELAAPQTPAPVGIGTNRLRRLVPRRTVEGRT